MLGTYSLLCLESNNKNHHELILNFENNQQHLACPPWLNKTPQKTDEREATQVWNFGIRVDRLRVKHTSLPLALRHRFWLID